MALFRYKALSATGESLDGQMEAGSADEVIVKLQDQGYLPVEARREWRDWRAWEMTLYVAVTVMT